MGKVKSAGSPSKASPQSQPAIPPPQRPPQQTPEVSLIDLADDPPSAQLASLSKKKIHSTLPGCNHYTVDLLLLQHSVICTSESSIASTMPVRSPYSFRFHCLFCFVLTALDNRKKLLTLCSVNFLLLYYHVIGIVLIKNILSTAQIFKDLAVFNHFSSCSYYSSCKWSPRILHCYSSCICVSLIEIKNIHISFLHSLFQFNHSIFSCGCLLPESQEEWRCWLWHVCPVPNSHLWKHTDQVLLKQFYSPHIGNVTVVHFVLRVPSLAVSVLGVGLKISWPPSLTGFFISNMYLNCQQQPVCSCPITTHLPSIQLLYVQCYKTADFLHMFICWFSPLLWVAVFVINTPWLLRSAFSGSGYNRGGRWRQGWQWEGKGVREVCIWVALDLHEDKDFTGFMEEQQQLSAVMLREAAEEAQEVGGGRSSGGRYHGGGGVQ